jgi:pimeloyl-ACP methyl ester carboxylesterase
LTKTPADDRFDLNEYDLPPADAFIMLAAHLGEGHILMHMIDPSVSEEGEPLSRNAALDPFHPQNGYRQPPESSRYEPEFVTEYRKAQRARVARIDGIAREHLAQRREAREAIFADDFREQPWELQASALRQSVVCPYMTVYRTEADLRAFDLSLDPSDRDAGSLFSYRPDLTNYMEFGFARISTPRAWLSTWSGLSSNANVLQNAPKLRVPALIVSYAGDNAIFPADARAALDAVGSNDKQLVTVPGDHYGFATGTQTRSGAPLALARITTWLRERFPA